MEMFPLRLNCDREKGWSEHDFRSIFIINKPDDLSWYGYDVVIHSPTEVTFDVWDMYDNVYGGCGEVIAEVKATVKPVITRKYIVAKAAHIAEARIKQEKKYEEAVKVAYMAESILNELEF